LNAYAGLILGGPLAPVAAMVTAGMLGGAMVGGAAGSLISCREVGVKNDSHLLIQYKEMRHPDGFMVEMSKDGRYRPTRGYNHHVHPSPHMDFDYDYNYDYVDGLIGPPDSDEKSMYDPMMMNYRSTNYDRFIKKGPVYPGYFWRHRPRYLRQSFENTFVQATTPPPIFYSMMEQHKLQQQQKQQEQLRQQMYQQNTNQQKSLQMQEETHHNDSRNSVGGFVPIGNPMMAMENETASGNPVESAEIMSKSAFMNQRQQVMLTPPMAMDYDYEYSSNNVQRRNPSLFFQLPAHAYSSYPAIMPLRPTKPR
jgi:hypothetical protein